MNLIEEIKQSNSISLSSGAKKGNIETCQKKLCSLGAAPIPLSYANFLGKINGIYSQDISVFGVDVKEPYEDIYKKNSLAGAISPNKIFLGASLTEYFIYDWFEKSYVIIDKKTDNNVFKSPFLEEALAQFLKNYI